MYYIDHYDSPFGGITLASDGTALNGLWFDGQKYFGDTLPSCGAQADGDTGRRRRGRASFRRKLDPLQKEATRRGAGYIFDQAKEWLELYFHGEIPDFMPLLAMFQEQEPALGDQAIRMRKPRECRGTRTLNPTVPT